MAATGVATAPRVFRQLVQIVAMTLVFSATAARARTPAAPPSHVGSAVGIAVHRLQDNVGLSASMIFPAAPGVTDGFTLLAFEPERSLVLGWTTPEGGRLMTWAFALEDAESGSTRQIVRVRVKSGARVFGLPWWAAKAIISVTHFFMQRKQLLGIARRAGQCGDVETRGLEERQDAA